MTFSRSVLLGLILTLASCVFSVWLLPHLPDQIPHRWDLEGNPVAWGPKLQYAFLLPAVAAFVWVLLIALPRVAPHGFRLDPFLDIYALLCAGLIAVFSFFNVVILLQASGHVQPLGNIIYAGVGLLLAFLGNYMGKLRKNFFIGVRTPWTLASEEVWVRTHRLTGWVWVIAGLALIVDGLLRPNVAALRAIIAVAVLTPLISSFVLYWRIEGFGPDPTS
jgi:uncharacterized membrane protein